MNGASIGVKSSHAAALFVIAFLVSVGLVLRLRDSMPLGAWPWGVDIYSNWLGCHAIWQGQNPYTDQVTAQIQQLIYGRPTAPNETVFRFFYPAYLALILLPILLLPVAWAAVAWCAAMWAVLFTLTVCWSWSLQPRVAPWLWGLILFSALLFRPALSGIIYGQYGLFVLGCLALSSWLISRQCDGAAGVLLMPATIKPSIGLLLPIPILLWAMRWKRWRILIGFGIAVVVLVGISVVQIGWWIPDWLSQSARYLTTDPGLAWSPAWIVTLPGLGLLTGALMLSGVGMWQLWRERGFPWLAVMGALYLNLALTPHTTEYDLIMLLIPLFWLGVEWRSFRWGLLFWMLLVWLPWFSWVAVIAMHGEIAIWWRAIWQFYPQLLLGVTLLWLGWKWMRQRTSLALEAKR